MQNFKEDKEAIKAFLNSSVDSGELAEMKKASALVEAPNIDKKPDMKKLKKLFDKIETTQSRNVLIVKSYENGYSQHMIAKVLGLNQATVQRIIKRTK